MNTTRYLISKQESIGLIRPEMKGTQRRFHSWNGTFSLLKMGAVISMDSNCNLHLHQNAAGMRWNICVRSSLNRIKYIVEGPINSVKEEGGDDTEEDGLGEYGSEEAESGAEPSGEEYYYPVPVHCVA